MRVKQAPKDWRAVDTRPGGLLRKDAAAAPKDAWGTETTVSAVSKSALEEAGALPEDLEPLPLSQRLKWPLLGAMAVAVVGLLVDAALTFVEVGGDKQQVKQGAAIIWDDVFREIRSAVADQQVPEARAETLRQLTQKLLGKTDFDLSGALTSALAVEEAKPE